MQQFALWPFSTRPAGNFRGRLKQGLLWGLLCIFLFGQTPIVWAIPSGLPALVENNEINPEKMLKAVRKLVRQGDWQTAETNLRQILTADPKYHPARLELAYLYVKQRRLSEAYDEISFTTTSEPPLARAHSIKGIALLRSGYFGLAYDELKLALGIDQQDDLALAAIAEVAYYENQLEQAERLINNALSRNHNEPDYYLLQARIASRMERFRVAADALKDFLRVTPKTDIERRDRIEGVIRFYSYLGDSHTNVVEDPRSATIPLTIRNRRPHVKVKINGKGPLNFVIDTGAGISVVSLTTAEKLGIKPVAQGGQARAVGGQGAFPIVYGFLKSLEIGNIKITSVPVYLREVQGARTSAPNEGTDGFLGLSVLNEFLVTLDYQSKELKMEPNTRTGQPIVTQAIDPQASTIPFRFTESGLISIETTLDGAEKMHFIFDSGASISVISDRAVKRLHWEDKILDTEKIHIVGAAGVTQNVELLQTKTVQVADLVKQDVRLPVLDLVRLNESAGFEQHGILGGDFLYHCRVQINFATQNLIFTPFNDAVRRVNLQTTKELDKHETEPVP